MANLSQSPVPSGDASNTSSRSSSLNNKLSQDTNSGEESDSLDDKNYKRLWIGNLDPKLTEYKETSTAQKCMDTLNGKRILEKMVVVRWAHQTTFAFPDDEEKLRRMLPALGSKSEPERSQNKEKTISAIEAKLRAMERDTLHFHLSNPSATSSATQPGTSNTKTQTFYSNYPNTSAASAFARVRTNINNKNKPYERNNQRRK